MKKRYISLLLVSATIAFVLVAGCTSPTQKNVAPANQTQNASSSTSTTSARTTASSPVSSKSAPSVPATPSAPSTPSPAQSSGKIATTINGDPLFYSDNTVARSSPKTTWAFSVVTQGAQFKTLCGVPLTAAIDGRAIGKLIPQASSGCFYTANYELSAQDTAGLSVGTHTLTISFPGDNSYQPAKQGFQIQVT
ncbi:MAG: hypothetical protein ACXVI3_00580 [Halobacteriota archaeon]